MDFVKRICLVNFSLIKLRNGLRFILFKEYYKTIDEVRAIKMELTSYCNFLGGSLDEDEDYVLSLSLNQSSCDSPLWNKQTLKRNIRKFLRDIKRSTEKTNQKYKKCYQKQYEVSSYLAMLENKFKASIVICPECAWHPPMRAEPSQNNMYKLPYMGLQQEWEDSWVCEEHFKTLYEHRILDKQKLKGVEL